VKLLNKLKIAFTWLQTSIQKYPHLFKNDETVSLYRLFLLFFKELLMRSGVVFNHTISEVVNIYTINDDNDDVGSGDRFNTTTSIITNANNNNNYNNRKYHFKQHHHHQQQQHLLSLLFSYYKSIVKHSVCLYSTDKYFLELYSDIQLQNGDYNQANLISWRINKV